MEHAVVLGVWDGEAEGVQKVLWGMWDLKAKSGEIDGRRRQELLRTQETQAENKEKGLRGDSNKTQLSGTRTWLDVHTSVFEDGLLMGNT